MDIITNTTSNITNELDNDSTVVDVLDGATTNKVVDGGVLDDVTGGNQLIVKPILFNTRNYIYGEELKIIFANDAYVRKYILSLLKDFLKENTDAKNKYGHRLQKRYMPHSMMDYYTLLVPKSASNLDNAIQILANNYKSGKTNIKDNDEYADFLHTYVGCVKRINKIFMRIIIFSKMIKAMQVTDESIYKQAYREACLLLCRCMLDLTPLLTVFNKVNEKSTTKSAFTSYQTLMCIKNKLNETYDLIRERLISAYVSYPHVLQTSDKSGKLHPLIYLSESLEHILPTFITRSAGDNFNAICKIPQFTRSSEYLIHLLRVYCVKFGYSRISFIYTIAVTWPNFSPNQEKNVISYLEELYALLLFIVSISNTNTLPLGIFSETHYIRLKFEDFFMPEIKKDKDGNIIHMSKNTFSNLITLLEHTMLTALVCATQMLTNK